MKPKSSKALAREGFDVIFDSIPPISAYQVFVVFCGIWLSIPAGAIQARFEIPIFEVVNINIIIAYYYSKINL